MKTKTLVSGMLLLMLAACNSPKETPKQQDDMKALYEQNLAVVKNCISSFESKNLTDFFNNVADSVKWYSPAYGDTITSKAHWMELLKGFADNWDKMHMNSPLFLPGLDSTAHKMDGSVRFYGSWDGVHKSGTATKSPFYGAYEFNKDHKIVEAYEYTDIGGLMAAVQPKAK